ncbi:MAG: hypothetical protein KAI61_06435 [Alphaproteobacteria bacterium]|nr:hypothetical protein [Alphaproteobacteria bacterium]
MLVVSAVSSVSAASSTYEATSAALAESALNSLMETPELLQSLASRSFKYLPPSYTMVLSTFWGLINVNENSTLVQSDVERAVREVGGSAADGMALWSQMDPEYEGVISAGDFAQNEYLTKTITEMLETVQENVDQVREEETAKSATSNSLLDYAAPGGASGSVLDLFA